MPIWDKLKPQTKVIDVPKVVEPVKPVEIPKPVELPPPPEPDFSKPETATPFETPLSLAQQYFERAKEEGQLTPEMQAKIAAYTEVSHILSEGWQAEQQAAEAERMARHPFKKLEDALVAGTDRKYSALSQSAPNITRELSRLSSDLQGQFAQEKLISTEPDQAILDKLIASGKVLSKIDVGKLVNGRWQGDSSQSSFPVSELPAMLKALGAIPPESPEGGAYPRDNENGYLIALLNRDGKATTADAEVGYGQQTREITEFTRPTSIEGVSVVLGFSKDRLVNSNRYYNSNGYPGHDTFRLELTPQFLAKSVGIQSSEAPAPATSAE